jgi:hypothetical protein
MYSSTQPANGPNGVTTDLNSRPARLLRIHLHVDERPYQNDRRILAAIIYPSQLLPRTQRLIVWDAMSLAFLPRSDNWSLNMSPM